MKTAFLATALLLLASAVPNDSRADEKRKPTVSVAPSESSVSGWQPALGKGLADMMITELSKLQNVKVLESVALDDLRAERALGESGEVAQSESVKKGYWKGADYTLKTVITRFGSKESSFGGGGVRLPVPFVGGGGFAVKQSENEVQIDWRIIDNTTREPLKADRATGVEKGSGFNFSHFGNSGFSDNREFMSSALGKATMKAIAQIVDQLQQWDPPAKSGRDQVAEATAADSAKKDASALAEKRRAKGEVLLVEDGKIWVSLGSQNGMQKGDKIKIYKSVEKKNKAGKVIATEYEPVTEIELSKIQKDRSWGSYTGTAKLEEGWPAAHSSVEIDDLN